MISDTFTSGRLGAYILSLRERKRHATSFVQKESIEKKQKGRWKRESVPSLYLFNCCQRHFLTRWGTKGFSALFAAAAAVVRDERSLPERKCC